jgi:FHA domain-containing protein
VITIEVLTQNGNPLPTPINVAVGASGGTIGRATSSTLVLPDTDRTVSRTHAEIVNRDGQPVLISKGLNGLLIDNELLAQGQERELHDGCEIKIGLCHMRVRHTPQAAPEPVVPAVEADPFADLMGAAAPPPPPPQAPQPAPSSSAAGSGMLPDDFDPFADPTQSRAIERSALPSEADLDFGGSSSSNIDQMFALDGQGQMAPEPVPEGGPSLDPLAAFNDAPAAPSAQSVPDQVPEIHSAFTPPVVQSRARQPKPAAPKPRPSAPAAPAAEALMQSFLEGLGTPSLQLANGLTPEMMQRVGVLLREATKGTLDLLRARATTKREVRASVTMIVARNNNPLKFSPDVSAALGYLIRPPEQGFMQPAEAMRDAYDDLRAHQMGMMAGMRTALAAVLARFAPDQLEERLTQKSVMDSLLPTNRKAKLWDLFHELYRDIAQEAEDDFHSLFGREFLRGYEEQIKRLEAGAGDEESR